MNIQKFFLLFSVRNNYFEAVLLWKGIRLIFVVEIWLNPNSSCQGAAHCLIN